MNGKDYSSNLMSTSNRTARKYLKSADRLIKKRPDWLKGVTSAYAAFKVGKEDHEQTQRRKKRYKGMMDYIGKWSPERRDALNLPSELDYIRGDKKADYKGFEFSTDTLDVLARKESMPRELLDVLGLIEKDFLKEDEGDK